MNQSPCILYWRLTGTGNHPEMVRTMSIHPVFVLKIFNPDYGSSKRIKIYQALIWYH